MEQEGGCGCGLGVMLVAAGVGLVVLLPFIGLPLAFLAAAGALIGGWMFNRRDEAKLLPANRIEEIDSVDDSVDGSEDEPVE